MFGVNGTIVKRDKHICEHDQFDTSLFTTIIIIIITTTTTATLVQTQCSDIELAPVCISLCLIQNGQI